MAGQTDFSVRRLFLADWLAVWLAALKRKLILKRRTGISVPDSRHLNRETPAN
jgi:hypothetical protein